MINQGAPALVLSEVRRRPRRSRWIAAAVVAVVGTLGACWAWWPGNRPGLGWSEAPKVLATVAVDRGDVALVVTETGSLESSDNAVVRCEVESFYGLPTGAAAVAARTPTRGMSASSRMGGGAASSAPKAAAPAKGQAPGMPKDAASAKAKAVGAGVASKADGKGPAAGSSNASAALDAFLESAAGTGVVPDPTALKRPDVQSFSYIIEPHVPLRTNAYEPTPTSGRPPLPPTILGILDEGTPVKAGDVVCQLDSSAFRTELQAQEIRCAQAKAWVEQARTILDVEQMSLREYEDGIFPRDVEAINNYIAICRKNVERARMTVDWAREAARKNIRSRAQLNADLLSLKQAEITLREGEGMLERLVKYTGKRISAARQAKIEAIRADKLSLESAYQLEKERKERLEKMIAHCTMRAPRDGIVVHANQANLWGTVAAPIQEGITVYPSQPIFRLPNPKQMQVKAEINESKVAQIRPGQPAQVRIDAFPDRAFPGRVTDVQPIPAPAHGPMSDVRVYHATIDIDTKGLDALRPGLSAEVEFQVEARRQVARVPLEALRWVDDQAFVALANDPASGSSWRWRPVILGLSDTSHAEIITGLEPGDRVIEHPDELPAPKLYREAGSRSILALERHRGR